MDRRGSGVGDAAERRLLGYDDMLAEPSSSLGELRLDNSTSMLGFVSSSALGTTFVTG